MGNMGKTWKFLQDLLPAAKKAEAEMIEEIAESGGKKLIPKDSLSISSPDPLPLVERGSRDIIPFDDSIDANFRRLDNPELPPPTASSGGSGGNIPPTSPPKFDLDMSKELPPDSLSYTPKDSIFKSLKKPLLYGGAGLGALGIANLASSPEVPYTPIPPKTEEQLVPPIPPTQPTSETSSPNASSKTRKLSSAEVSTSEDQQQKSLQDLMDLYIEAQSIGTQENLQKAMDERNKLRRDAQLSRGFEHITAGLTGGKPDFSDYEQQMKLSEQPLKDLESKMEMEKSDPKSAHSEAFRKFASKFGVKIGGNFSAAMGEKILPMIYKAYEAEEKRKADKETAKLRREEISAFRSEKDAQRSTERQDKFIFDVSKTAQPIINEYSKMSKAGDTIRTMTDKTSPGEQVTLLYSFISTLDPQSAVREGEVTLAKSMQSVMGKAESLYNKYLTKGGGILDQNTINELKNEVLRLEKAGTSSYKRKMGIFHEQAKSRGIPEERFKEFDPYHDRFKPPTTPEAADVPSSSIIDKVKQMTPEQQRRRLEELRSKHRPLNKQ